MTLPRKLIALATAAVLAVAAGCGTEVKNPVTGRTERSVMDERAELAEGRKAHDEVLKEYGVVKHPGLQAYVNGVGQKLAKQSHRPELPWTFTVLDSPEVNAFALPGGYVYVTRGIMAYLDSEADLAGVIGHEIGHVTARHGAQRATRQQNAGLGVLAASVLGMVLEAGGIGGAADLAGQVSQGVAAGYVARYSREQELQADQLGAEYLARAQYDPRNMVDVIQVLRDQDQFRADRARAEGREPASGNNWLASHPSSEQRLAEIRQRAAAYKGQFGDDGRQRFLRAIDGMPFGDNAEQGLVRGSEFYHPELGFAISAPPGWRIVNDAEVLTLVNREGDAALLLRLVPQNAGSTHEEIIRNLVKPEQGQTERLTLRGGLSATHFSGTRRDAQGQRRNVELTIASGPGNRHYLLQHAARDASALQRARTGLRDATLSFRTMTAADRSAAQPWRVRTQPLPAGGFAELARRSPLGDSAEAQLRLLNGAYSGTAPRAGQVVKVVEAAER